MCSTPSFRRGHPLIPSPSPGLEGRPPIAHGGSRGSEGAIHHQALEGRSLVSYALCPNLTPISLFMLYLEPSEERRGFDLRFKIGCIRLLVV